MTPPPTPAERFDSLLRSLTQYVVARCGWRMLSQALVALIVARIRTLKHRFADFAARLAAGTYKPRRFAPRQQAPGRPPPVDPLPNKFGWLLPLVPYAAAACGTQLRLLLLDPQMLAVLAAAPESLRRPVRSLCRMLAVETPPVLARPKPAPSPKPAASTRPAGKTPSRRAGTRPRQAATPETPSRQRKTPPRPADPAHDPPPPHPA